MLNLELEMGDWATWVGSIGTIGAFAVAFWQIHRERTARRTRDKHERWMRRREHVDRVSAWIHDSVLHINNDSGHPIHEVLVSDGDRELMNWTQIPPGTHRDETIDEVDHGTVHLEFTDIRGDRWSRAPGNEPELIDQTTPA
ncbi:hypothetical protein [Gordonia phthalatica]|uniref:Uncharacterized protein n=1 Tax=Gordonia phthalatica TaxID=1136941 RepID=A0A0N9MQI4_9ACTN|nr:hypothetical protein [Gordonia phthalatica]ALG84590.1 hypothetical protein ACH46_08915 [Gordonia phthalatica]